MGNVIRWYLKLKWPIFIQLGFQKLEAIMSIKIFCWVIVSGQAHSQRNFEIAKVIWAPKKLRHQKNINLLLYLKYISVHLTCFSSSLNGQKHCKTSTLQKNWVMMEIFICTFSLFLKSINCNHKCLHLPIEKIIKWKDVIINKNNLNMSKDLSFVCLFVF